MRFAARFAVGVFLCLAAWQTQAAEISYLEDFALAKNRTVPLQQLIPGTEDYYYYHCLHLQNTEQFDKVDRLLTAWINRCIVTHSCSVSGVEPFPVGIAADDRLPWYVAAVRSGNKLFLKNLPEDFPPEAVKERRVCLAQGIKSSVAIPLRVGGAVLGIISF